MLVCAVFPVQLVLGFPGLFGLPGYLSWDLCLDCWVRFAGFLVAFGVSHGCVFLERSELYRLLIPRNGVIQSLTSTPTSATLTEVLWHQPLWQKPWLQLSDSGHSDRSPLTAALWQQLGQQPDNCAENDSQMSLPWACSVNKKFSSFENEKSVLVTTLQACCLPSTLQRWRQ